MTRTSREELRAKLLSRIPRWYSPWLHLAFPAAAGGAIVGVALSRVHGLHAWELLFVPLFLAVGNAVEWHAHRDLLHRPTWPLRELYVRHTPQHHAVYVPEDMAIRDWRELKLVLLPAYGVLAFAGIASPVAIALALAREPNLAALWLATVVSYLLAYEWLHLAYHLPASHPAARLPLVARLRRHHQRHHAPALMQRWNFNVTVPFWDAVRGTIWRAPHPLTPVRGSGTKRADPIV